jgi:hypothetical protein
MTVVAVTLTLTHRSWLVPMRSQVETGGASGAETWGQREREIGERETQGERERGGGRESVIARLGWVPHCTPTQMA